MGLLQCVLHQAAHALPTWSQQQRRGAWRASAPCCAKPWAGVVGGPALGRQIHHCELPLKYKQLLKIPFCWRSLGRAADSARCSALREPQRCCGQQLGKQEGCCEGCREPHTTRAGAVMVCCWLPCCIQQEQSSVHLGFPRARAGRAAPVSLGQCLPNLQSAGSRVAAFNVSAAVAPSFTC